MFTEVNGFTEIQNFADHFINIAHITYLNYIRRISFTEHSQKIISLDIILDP